MAVPKRKVSKARKKKRRSHLALNTPSLARCPRCKHATLLHQVCPNCGHYKGRMVLDPDKI
ncbi:MAG: 50S ribosomal protein L32 [Planctomycetota bacterium]|nr:MAG: 50S ribosomal protein L32 [Planctomycetota bacterium]